MKLIFLVMALTVAFIDATFLCLYKRLPSRFGHYNYFIKWDNKKQGGRFFECDVYAKVDGSPYSDAYVVAHDGDTGTFSRGLIFRLGVIPEVNDNVIAYWDKRAYAFSGKVTAKRPGSWFVEYDDGHKGWIRDEWVHQKVLFKRTC